MSKLKITDGIKKHEKLYSDRLAISQNINIFHYFFEGR